MKNDSEFSLPLHLIKSTDNFAETKASDTFRDGQNSFRITSKNSKVSFNVKPLEAQNPRPLSSKILTKRPSNNGLYRDLIDPIKF
jgi:hypothetical protein